MKAEVQMVLSVLFLCISGSQGIYLDPVTNKKQEKEEKKRTSTRATVQQGPTLSFVIEAAQAGTASE